jgi:hypothetical protein
MLFHEGPEDWVTGVPMLEGRNLFLPVPGFWQVERAAGLLKGVKSPTSLHATVGRSGPAKVRTDQDQQA